jgi:hypothetical protein
LVSASYSGSVAQPYTFSGVGERTSGFTTQFTIASGADGGIQAGWSNATNTAFIYNGGGGVGLATASDSVLHSFQVIYNFTTSIISIDASNTSVAVSTGDSFTGVFCMGACGGNPAVQISTEIGWWSADKSSNFVALSANQLAYW